MAFAITAIGPSFANTSGGSVFITTVAVPKGATIIVAANDASNSAGNGSWDDGGINTYTLLNRTSKNNVQANGFLQVSYTMNIAAALAVSTHLSYTKGNSGSEAEVAGVYITGGPLALDTSATASAFGSSATPSVTSGVPDGANELFIGFSAQTGKSAYTQASGFANPPDLINSSNQLTGGNKLNTAATAVTFNPGYAGTNAWALVILALKNISAPPIDHNMNKTNMVR